MERVVLLPEEDEPDERVGGETDVPLDEEDPEEPTLLPDCVDRLPEAGRVVVGRVVVP